MTDVVTIADVQRAGLCVSGARRWFAAHNLDFRAFIKNGLPVATLEALKDEYADRAIAAAKADRHG